MLILTYYVVRVVGSMDHAFRRTSARACAVRRVRSAAVTPRISVLAFSHRASYCSSVQAKILPTCDQIPTKPVRNAQVCNS